MQTRQFTVSIVGMTPLIVHKWSEKALRQIRDKQAGEKKIREKKNPQEDYESSMYRLSDGSHGFPVTGIKGAMISAAHKDLGIEKTRIRQGVFLESDEGILVRIHSKSGPHMREDLVRVGQGSADIRYRAEFADWQIDLRVVVDTDKISMASVINILERAGFGVGIGEWRPELTSGEFGRFFVKKS